MPLWLSIMRYKYIRTSYRPRRAQIACPRISPANVQSAKMVRIMVAFSVGYVRYGSAYMRLWPVARGKATVCRAELTVCRVQCQMFVIVIYWALQLAATCAIARAGAGLRVNVNVKGKSNVKSLTLNPTNGQFRPTNGRFPPCYRPQPHIC